MASGYPRASVRKRSLHVQIAKRGWRFEDLGIASGVPKSTVAGVANGTRCPLRTAEKIAKALGKPVEKLFNIEHRRVQRPEQLRLPEASSPSERRLVEPPGDVDDGGGDS